MKFRLALAQIAVFVAFGTHQLAAQIITSFSPTVGAAGDSITIYGNSFVVGDKTYFFNGRLASAPITSDNQFTATVPTGTTTGPIGIQRGAGAINYSPGDFTVVGAGPYITDVSPNLGAVGDSVTINGVHFTGATSVKFNGTSASFAPDGSGTHIFLNVPAGATSGSITVTGPGGTATSPSAFTVIGPGPYISGFSPAVGGSNTTVFINGRFFTGQTNVTFKGAKAQSAVVTSDTQIQAVTPTDVTSGPIKVMTPQGSYTSPTNFFVPPSVTGFSPGTGAPSSSVNITGKNFAGATAVMMNGTAASYAVLNNSNISATVPAGINSGLVRVTAPAGTAFSSSNFRIQPTLSGFSPNAGPAGTSVTINGANLNEGLSSVKFNGVSASFATPAFGSVVATAPSATTGFISLTTSNGTATTVSSFFFPPSITSFTPGSGSGGTSVAITGQNFAGATAVTFNGVAAAFVVNNNTSISATAPAGVSTGAIKVTAPAGTATSASLFYGPPALTGFAPTHGVVGTTVTISGVNLLSASAVQFGGTNATSFTVVNNTSIQAAVPSGAVTGPITVIAPAGSYTTTTNFVLDYRSDLAVTITDDPDPVTVGSNLVYNITVYNGGPDHAPNVFLTNYLSTSVTLKSAVASQGTLATSGRTNVASLGTVFAFGQASITLTVTPTNVGTIFDSANAGSGYVDPVASNSVASAITVVQPLPRLSISRAATNQVKVSWVIGLSNYSLQYNSALPTNSPWVSNSTARVLSNNQFIVTEPATNARRFYRLIR